MADKTENAPNLFDGLAQKHQKKSQRSKSPTVEASPDVAPVEPESPKRGRAKGKRSNSDYTQVGAYIPKDLKRQVDRLLFDEDDTDFSDLVASLLQEWVSGKSVK